MGRGDSAARGPRMPQEGAACTQALAAQPGLTQGEGLQRSKRRGRSHQAVLVGYAPGPRGAGDWGPHPAGDPEGSRAPHAARKTRRDRSGALGPGRPQGLGRDQAPDSPSRASALSSRGLSHGAPGSPGTVTYRLGRAVPQGRDTTRPVGAGMSTGSCSSRPPPAMLVPGAVSLSQRPVLRGTRGSPGSVSALVRPRCSGPRDGAKAAPCAAGTLPPPCSLAHSLSLPLKCINRIFRVSQTLSQWVRAPAPQGPEVAALGPVDRLPRLLGAASPSAPGPDEAKARTPLRTSDSLLGLIFSAQGARGHRSTDRLCHTMNREQTRH